MWYRIYLTVRDSAGATHTVQRDLLPRKARLTLATNPTGLQLRLDGQPVDRAIRLRQRRRHRPHIQAVTPQASGTTTYQFASWSDGGAATHNIATPASDQHLHRELPQAASGGRTACRGRTSTTSISPARSFTRIDPTVNFDWGTGSPAPTIGVRHVQRALDRPGRGAYSGTYTFYTVSDDGVRLWVNGQLIVNNWTDHAPPRTAARLR